MAYQNENDYESIRSLDTISHGYLELPSEVGDSHSVGTISHTYLELPSEMGDSQSGDYLHPPPGPSKPGKDSWRPSQCEKALALPWWGWVGIILGITTLAIFVALSIIFTQGK